MSKLSPLLVFGTRPEAIKMAPVVQECLARKDQISPVVCLTGQHREMLDQVTDYFGIRADIDLELMSPNQSLSELTARCLTGLDGVVKGRQPDCVVAQGDTTTVMCAAIVAFYWKLPFVHVEAGLRTHDLWSPWPEEFNRRVASLVTSLSCAPTERAAANLIQEGVAPHTVHVTGNTVIDALLKTVERERNNSATWQEKYAFLGDRRMILITGHRRENFGRGFRELCQALTELAHNYADVEFLYPVHLNPNVRKPVFDMLDSSENIHLVEPAPYPEFVWLMDRSTIILSDSGGVQEEAPSLRKPVLVTRDTTERPEAVDAGAVELVGTDRARIVERISTLLDVRSEYERFQIDQNPYGDGHAAKRIVDLMLQQNWNS